MRACRGAGRHPFFTQEGQYAGGREVHQQFRPRDRDRELLRGRQRRRRAAVGRYRTGQVLRGGVHTPERGILRNRQRFVPVHDRRRQGDQGQGRGHSDRYLPQEARRPGREGAVREGRQLLRRMRLQLLQGTQGGPGRQRIRGGRIGEADDILRLRDVVGRLESDSGRIHSIQGIGCRRQAVHQQARVHRRYGQGGVHHAGGRHRDSNRRGVHRAGRQVRGGHRDGHRRHAGDG